MPVETERVVAGNDLEECCNQYVYLGHHLGIGCVPELEHRAIYVAQLFEHAIFTGTPPPVVSRIIDWGGRGFRSDGYLQDEVYAVDDEYCDEERCEESDGERDGGLIHSYSFLPRWRFNGTDSRVFMGAEIEVENERNEIGTDEGARLAVDNMEWQSEREYFGFLKEDGSLTNGFEIVTHPMTLKYAVDNFPWRTLTSLYQVGFRGTSTCGLHVHVTREAFDGPGHVYRWLKLIYRNPTPIQAIARRGSVHYAAWDRGVRLQAKEHAKGSRLAPRYVAVNVQNDATFEVRLFRSSLRPAAIKAAFAFVDSTVEYARQLSVPDIAYRNGWSWQAYMAYVVDNGERWNDLLVEESARLRGRVVPQDYVPSQNRSHNPWGITTNSWGETVPGYPRPAREAARDAYRLDRAAGGTWESRQAGRTAARNARQNGE